MREIYTSVANQIATPQFDPINNPKGVISDAPDRVKKEIGQLLYGKAFYLHE